MVEDDVLFTNHLAGKYGIPAEVVPHGEDMAQAGCD